MICYLAGPINGCTDDQANNWREIVKRELGEDSCLDPMRRDYRGKEDESVSEIVQLDLMDINNSDLMIANCWQVSWGTAMEIFYAFNEGLPVLVVIPPDARISPWLRFHSDTIVHDMDDAIKWLESWAEAFDAEDAMA